jgi:molybdopterin molybdotransferase
LVGRVIPVAEAQSRLLALVRPLEIERLSLIEAAGRYAADDVIAQRTQPAADLSAMDGYAIRFAERPGPWTIVGESAAGADLPSPLAPGEAMRIFTGAPLPDGADTILVQEDAAADRGRLTMTGEGPSARGKHIRTRGSSFAEGDRLVAAGEELTPARIALVAMAGHGSVAVRRRVRVALLSTGNELLPPGTPASGVQLPASNGPMLAAMLKTLPVEIIDLGIVRDDLDQIADRIAGADADVLVTTGGASVGDHDLVLPAIERAGGTVDFWRIAMRPGKPLMAARRGEMTILGLPGNPVSAFVTATLFLKPLVRALAGAASAASPIRRAALGSALPAVGKRADYLRGRLTDGRVVPVIDQDSASLTALSEAQLLIVRHAEAPPAVAGDGIDVIDIT